jgi:hypothetical protein
VKRGLAPLFLERRSYRRRRLSDAARVLPLLGIFLLLMPLLWVQAEPDSPVGTGETTRYIFAIWSGLIVAAWAVSAGFARVGGRDINEESGMSAAGRIERPGATPGAGPGGRSGDSLAATNDASPDTRPDAGGFSLAGEPYSDGTGGAGRGTEDAGTEDAGTEDAGTEDGGAEHSGAEEGTAQDDGVESRSAEDGRTEHAGAARGGGDVARRGGPASGSDGAS